MWVSLATAAVSGVSALLGGNAKRDSAKAANKARKESYEYQQQAKIAQYRFNQNVSDANYAWEMARFNGLKLQEEQRKLDYEYAAGRTIDYAVENLELNVAALKDQFETGEALRAEQEMMNLQLTTDQNINRIDEIGLAANLNEINTKSQVAQYMIGVQQNALRQNQILQRQDEQVQQLLGSIAVDMQSEMLQRDIATVASMVDQGIAKSRSSARTGGTSTATQLAANSAKALGRAYGELEVRRQARNNSIDLMNLTMKGTGMEMMQVARQTELLKLNTDQTIKQSVNTGKRLNNQSKLINIQQNYAEDVYQKLTLPGFKLAANQGQRELRALEIGTLSTMEQAGMPYRAPILFEPQRAIPGLLPYDVGPTMQSVPSQGSIIGNAFAKGAKGFMSGAYKKADGSLTFL